MSFKKGQRVRLKSGGPVMTVSDVDEKIFPHGKSVPFVICVWFCDNGELKNKDFDPELLELVEDR